MKKITLGDWIERVAKTLESHQENPVTQGMGERIFYLPGNPKVFCTVDVRNRDEGGQEAFFGVYTSGGASGNAPKELVAVTCAYTNGVRIWLYKDPTDPDGHARPYGTNSEEKSLAWVGAIVAHYNRPNPSPLHLNVP